ncbi:PadR family transcriptional regulator [Novosphingobium mathurense]|uniref:Transcriptional regulator, PadR family n=1 Tax=Novosphingobium mathurense TaxID=428990 RepID=A0A1U6H0J3_9SPHN|nr:transcriptional regulator, PadR family [Novosphingobium mathurense]
MRQMNGNPKRGGRRFARDDYDMDIALVRRARGMRGRRGGMRGPFGPGRDGLDDEIFEGRGRHGRGGGAGGLGFGGGRGMRGGRRRRIFDQAELQTLLLALIAEAPRHGYDLIREIEAISGGEYAPSPGVVYPALTYMEEAGWIAVGSDEGARKSYEATEEGRRQTEADADKAKTLRQRLAALAEAREKVDPAPVRRAMQNLKTAVFDRLSVEGADRKFILRVAEAIDEATRNIERIEK